MRQLQRTFLILSVVLLAFFLLKRPAYYGDATEPFFVDGGDIVKYVGIAIGVLLGVAGILYLAIRWMERGTVKPQFNNYGNRIN